MIVFRAKQVKNGKAEEFKMNDYIEIDNLIVFANHGVFDEEKTMGQRFMISLRLYTDVATPAKSDDITKSVNYGEVCEFVTEFTKTHRSKLIETAAENIAYALLLRYPLLTGVDVQLKKPWAPIGLPLDNVLVNVARKRTTTYLSLGSNMGDKKGYLDYAIEKLNENEYCKVIKVSDYIETEPVGGVVQDNFLNACVKIETLLPPYELLKLIGEIEAEAGRTREVHWGPRTLDIDILLYGDSIITSETLTVPHIEMANRRFVLEPMMQIAPYAYHPIKRKFIAELLDDLKEKEARSGGNARLL